MITMPYRLRENILRMQPYSPGKPIEEVQKELGLTNIVKLASNENPFGPSPKAIAAVQSAASEMHIYPDAAGAAVRAAIAEKFGIGPEQILLGNGSDELIHLLGLVLLGDASDEVIVGDPSFVRYNAAAEVANCRLIKVPLTADLVHDLDAMLAAVTPRTRMVFIANPNNPTGTIISREALCAFLDRLPDGVVTVLDEAYFEFAATDPSYPDGLDLVKAGRPVVALRTFSKAYGLAGIRLGFGFAPADIVDAIHRVREPFNCNRLAQAAAIAALSDSEFISQTVDSNARGREFLMSVFREIGAHPWPSHANFVLADLHRPAQPVFEALLREGVIVRSGHVLGLPTMLRVSVGLESENQMFADAIRKMTAVSA